MTEPYINQPINWRSRIVKTGKVRAGDITPHPRNPRRHPAEQRKGVEASFDTLGQIAPIVINARNGYLVDGEERSWLALAQGDDTELDAVWVDLTEEEHDLALTVFDYITTMATYDRDRLDALLHEVKTDNPALQGMLAEMAAREGLYRDAPAVEDPGAQVDRAGELQQKWQVQRGDVWRISRHKIMCGDSTSAEDVARLMGGEKMQGAFTSPPYAEQRKEQYGGIPADEFVAWWEAIQANVRAHLKDDGSFFVNIKPHSEDGERNLYVMDMVLTMSRVWKWSYVDEFCWLRSGVPRQVQYSFKNGFEPVYQFAATRKGFKFRPDAVMHESDSVPIPGGKGVGNTAGKQGHKQHGKAASDLQGHSSWIFGGQEYAPGMAYPSNVLKGFSNDETRGHEAAFPVQLPDFFIRAYSDADDAWYDPFCGSGTTLVACEQTGRIGFGMEISPDYCSVILERLSGMGLIPELMP